LNSSAARTNCPCFIASWPARNDSSTCSSVAWQVANVGDIDQTKSRNKAARFIRTFSRESSIRSAKFGREEHRGFNSNRREVLEKKSCVWAGIFRPDA